VQPKSHPTANHPIIAVQQHEQRALYPIADQRVSAGQTARPNAPVAVAYRLRSTCRMQTLEALLRRFARRSHARWWVGKRPEVRDGRLAKAIAGQVGLPTSADDPFAPGRMVFLSRADAAHVLAVAGTTSLAYGEPSPSTGPVRDAKAALNDLTSDATFLSNGHWKADAPSGWNRATSATFDCGVIGFDHENALIFWVEEED